MFSARPLLCRPTISISGWWPNPQALSRVSTVVFSHRPECGRGCQGPPRPPPRSQDSLHLVYIQPWALEVGGGGSPGSQGKLPLTGSQGPGDRGWSRLHSPVLGQEARVGRGEATAGGGKARRV